MKKIIKKKKPTLVLTPKSKPTLVLTPKSKPTLRVKMTVPTKGPFFDKKLAKKAKNKKKK